MEKVRVGFIGVGGIAAVHLKNIHENEHAEIVAVCDIVKESAELKAKEYGAVAYTDADAMLGRESLDALFLCVPPFAHGDIEEKAAEQGIHLMVEKPLALDLETAQKKAEVIGQSDIIAASGYCLRYLDIVAKAKKYLADKKVAMVRGYYLTGFVETPWYRELSKSGGQLVEQSTHTVDLVRYLGGEIQKVYANMALQVMDDIPNINIPDVTSLNLVFESGAVGHVDSSFIQPDHRSGLELLGRDFRVEIDGMTVKIVDKDHTSTYTTKMNFYTEQDQAFIEAIRTGNTDLILATYEDGLQTLAVTLAANHSEETGQPVRMSEFVQS